MKNKPYKLNAEGDFYVEDGHCISCTIPHFESPNLIGEDYTAGYHCYFKKQPETAEEIEDAINAMNVSCCASLRYKGTDSIVINKIIEVGLHEQVDNQD